MIRFTAYLAAATVWSGSLLADLSPRQFSYDCQGEWQLGSDLRLGRLTGVVEDDRWAPDLLGGVSAGRMSVATHDGHHFSYTSVKTDGLHWYIYSEGEHMGMLSGTSGRILLDSPHGLFQGTCTAM